jgi:hypothetical protein
MLTLFISLVGSDLVDREYYENEYQKILELCNQDGGCKYFLNDNNTVDIHKQIRLLDKYYKIYWKNKNCHKENESCNFAWENCCSNLTCAYVKDKSLTQKQNFSLNENTGICSNPKVAYSIP